MNGQGRDPEEWPINADELRVERAALVLQDNPAGKGQVAVEPGVPDASAVCLDTHLKVSHLGFLGDRAHLADARQDSIHRPFMLHGSWSFQGYFISQLAKTLHVRE